MILEKRVFNLPYICVILLVCLMILDNDEERWFKILFFIYFEFN